MLCHSCLGSRHFTLDNNSSRFCLASHCAFPEHMTSKSLLTETVIQPPECRYPHQLRHQLIRSMQCGSLCRSPTPAALSERGGNPLAVTITSWGSSTPQQHLTIEPQKPSPRPRAELHGLAVPCLSVAVQVPYLGETIYLLTISLLALLHHYLPARASTGTRTPSHAGWVSCSSLFSPVQCLRHAGR